MRKTLLSLLALTLLLGASGSTQAQDLKPVAVLSVTSYDELLEDLAFMGKITDNPDLAQNLEGTLKLFTQGRGLEGLDQTRPWGVTVTTDGSQFFPVSFLPVSDLDKLLKALAGFAQTEDLGHGIKQVTPAGGGQQIFVKAAGGWAYIAQSEEGLDNVPADPLKLVGQLSKSYDIALRAYVQNVPELYRQMAVQQLKMGVQGGLQQNPDESDEQYELRQKMVQNQVESLTRAINETDTFTVGWKIDREEETTYVDVAMTAVPETRTAEQMAYLKNTTSSYAGFLLPDAAVTMNFAAKIGEQDIKDAVNAIEALRVQAMAQIDKDENLPDEASKQAVKDVMSDFIDVFVETIKTGKMDGGAAVLLEPEATKVVGGGYVADPAAFDDALRRLVELAENEDDFPGVDFEVEDYEGVQFHKMTVPVDDVEAQRAVGEELDVYLGVGKQSLYIALGEGSLDVLKDVIDASGKPQKVQPFQLAIALGSVMQFASTIEENPMLSMLAEEFEKSEGQDHILIVARPIPNGVTYRLKAESGVLKVLGQASRMAAGAGAGGF